MYKVFSISLMVLVLNGCTVLGSFADGALPEIEDTRTYTEHEISTGLPPDQNRSQKTNFFADLGLKVDQAIYQALTEGKPKEEVKQCQRVSATVTECVLIDADATTSNTPKVDEAQHELSEIERQLH